MNQKKTEKQNAIDMETGGYPYMQEIILVMRPTKQLKSYKKI